MKLAICTHMSLSYMGGGEREMCELANELTARGHDVEFFALPYTMGQKPKVNPLRILEGVPYHESWTHRVEADVAYTFYHPLSSLNFRVKGRKIASFHSQAFFMKSVSPSYGLVPAAASYGTRLIGPLELRTFDAIHTHFPQPTVRHKKTYIIPGWVDTNVFKPASAKHDQFTVLFSGRALWQKGWDIYVKLASRMKELGIRFLYVGGDIKDSVIHSLGFQWSPMALSQIYSEAHVLMNPVRVDTFGRVAIESMACVPYETGVSSPTDICRTHSRTFTGSLVTIETAAGSCLTLTPNHPILTMRGWVAAGLIRKGDIVVRADQSKMDEGRIGDLVEGEGWLHHTGAGGQAWTFGIERQTHAARYTFAKDAFEDEVQAISAYGGRAILLGGDNRWGGHHNFEELASRTKAPAELRTLYSDSEHISLAASMAQDQAQLSGGPLRNLAEPNWLHVRDKWLYELLPPAQGAPAVFGDQASPLSSDATLHRGAHEVAGARSSFRRIVRVASLYPMAKLETIASVTREPARSVKVYNLTTLGGHYSANGIVVHNCGTPVVTTPSVAHVGLNLPFVFGNSMEDYESSLIGLKRLWEDGKPYRQLSRKCNEAAQAFSFKNTATLYEEMFREVAHGVPN